MSQRLRLVITMALMAACEPPNAGPEPNERPVVTMTAPAAGNTAVVNTAVTVSAAAADADGSVTGVQFFDDATSIGSDTSNPYGITWTPVVAGPRSLTARASDNRGATTTSAPVAFTVTSPGGPDTEAPVATLTAPADQATDLTGALALAATAQGYSLRSVGPKDLRAAVTYVRGQARHHPNRAIPQAMGSAPS